MSIYADSESLWQWASSNGSRHYSQIRAQRQRQIQTNCKTQVVQYLERAKQKGCDCNAPQLSCRQRYIPEGALERACTAGVTWFSLWWRSSFLAEELSWRRFPFRFLFHLKKKNLPAWLFFFYYDRGVEIINEMTLKHCHRDFFACFKQITSELVSTNFCSGAVILFSTNAPNLSSSHTTSLEISQPPFASSS